MEWDATFEQPVRSGATVSELVPRLPARRVTGRPSIDAASRNLRVPPEQHMTGSDSAEHSTSEAVGAAGPPSYASGRCAGRALKNYDRTDAA